MGKSKRKIRPIKRGHFKKQPKRKFVLFCEGRNTEPSYFDALRASLSNALIEIEPIPGVGVPNTIADRAAEKAKELGLVKGSRKKLESFEESDQAWAVFDKDDHEVERAFDVCRANQVGIAFSNPCFEVWLILHYEDFQRPDDQHAVQKHLSTLCAEYDPNKGKTPNCHELIPEIEAAEILAERQCQRRIEEGDELGRPSTTVFKLSRQIRQAAEKSNFKS